MLFRHAIQDMETVTATWPMDVKQHSTQLPIAGLAEPFALLLMGRHRARWGPVLFHRAALDTAIATIFMLTAVKRTC